MIPAIGTGGSGIVAGTLLSCLAIAGILRDNVGLTAVRSVFAATFCIAAIVHAVDGGVVFRSQQVVWWMGEVTIESSDVLAFALTSFLRRASSSTFTTTPRPPQLIQQPWCPH